MQLITPPKTRWERIRDWFLSFSPQVKQGLIAATVGILLFIGGCFVNQKLKTKDGGNSGAQYVTGSGNSSPGTLLSAVSTGSNSPITQTVINNSYASATNDEYWVSLDTGSFLDPKVPFGTTLILENRSSHPIYHITDNFYWNDPTGPTKHVLHDIVGASEIPELKPHAKHGISIRPFSSQSSFGDFGPKTFVQIEISYDTRSPVGRKTERFAFCARRNEAGNFVWDPAGEGKSMIEVMNEIRPVTNTLELIPFLEIRVIGFEKIDPVSHAGRGLRMTFDAKNVGGVAATGLIAEWVAWDYSNGSMMYWTNRVIKTLPAEVISPGNNKTVWVDFTDPGNRIFEETMSGKLLWLAEIRYEDLNRTPFILEVNTERTNDLFVVRYHRIHSKFFDFPPK